MQVWHLVKKRRSNIYNRFSRLAAVNYNIEHIWIYYSRPSVLSHARHVVDLSYKPSLYRSMCRTLDFTDNTLTLLGNQRMARQRSRQRLLGAYLTPHHVQQLSQHSTRSRVGTSCGTLNNQWITSMSLRKEPNTFTGGRSHGKDMMRGDFDQLNFNMLILDVNTGNLP